MATKKPSVATQLKNLKIEHAALQQYVGKIEKDLAAQKQTNDYTNKSRNESQAEVDQAHSLLDVLPGVGRKSEPNEYGGTTAYTLSTRIAAFLAKRA